MSDEPTWPALVDRELWERVNDRITNTAVRLGAGRAPSRASTWSLASFAARRAGGRCMAPR